MNIHEYQAKQLLAKFGVAVPKGGVAYTPKEAVAVAKELGGPVYVVKSQIHAGGRGAGRFKGNEADKGGVRVVKSVEDVRASDVHPIRGESALANASHVTGSVAVMDRGAVSFCEKARRAQAAGAVALIVVNSSDDAFIIDSDGTSTDDIVLPIVCVRASDGAVRFNRSVS